MTGGIHAEWLVTCDVCGVDVEPGRFYDTESEAMMVRNRAVKAESWLLRKHGELVCPECAELPARTAQVEVDPDCLVDADAKLAVVPVDDHFGDRPITVDH